jgi:hypothetical protein
MLPNAAGFRFHTYNAIDPAAPDGRPGGGSNSIHIGLLEQENHLKHMKFP